MYQRTGFTADDFQAVLAPMETEKNEDGVVHKVRPPRPVEEDGGQLVAREQGAGKPGAHRVALIPRKEGDEGAKYLQYIQVLGAVERRGKVAAADRIPYKEGREVSAQRKEGRRDMLLRGEAGKNAALWLTGFWAKCGQTNARPQKNGRSPVATKSRSRWNE